MPNGIAILYLTKKEKAQIFALDFSLKRSFIKQYKCTKLLVINNT